MTQEEKQLLIADLCGRVPYGVIVEQTLFPPTIADKEQRLKNVQANNCVQLYWYKYINEFVPIHCIKPYLRPMSSMTKEEEKIYNSFINCIATNECGSWELVDWLNSNQFDYHGLIPMGLAIEAPEGMYDIKKEE